MSPMSKVASHGILAGVLLALMACGSRASEADANPPRNLESLRDFTSVTLAGPDRVVVTRGAQFSVRAEGDPRALARLEIDVRDGVLRIRRKHNWRDILPGEDRGATVNVTLPVLHEVALAGSGDISADVLSGDDVEASVSGSGDLTIARVEAAKAGLSATGSGTLTATGGRADRAELSVAGSGDIKAGGLVATAAEISIAGSGDAQAHVSGAARISIVGSGDAVVTGTTQCSVSRIGSGSARCTA